MIIKDKSVYLNYIQDIENKVNNLCKSIDVIPLSNDQKQSIEKNCAQILAKTALFSIRATSETGLIPNADWVNFKQEINGLYEQLSDTVNKAIAVEKLKTTITR